MARRRHFFGGPIISRDAASANLRRHVANAVDGRYKHPAGGTARKCEDCDGTGYGGFGDGKCSICHGSGVIQGV
jgi:DnaJ-class molecular chaperone